jgi:hypothetical protein
MNKKILIAYANKEMRNSLFLLGQEARFTHVFDKIILYTEKDLSEEILNSPLMKHKRGGGYWIWKPYIIWKTLQEYGKEDYVCYIDSGNKVFKGAEWDYYFSLLKKYDTICFQYQDKVPKWVNEFGTDSTAIKVWTKKETLDFFKKQTGNDLFLDFSKIMGGVVFCKGRSNKFIKEWLDTSLAHPELIMDPSDEELKNQYSFFSGYHRHDQSIITPLAYKYQEEGSLCVLPEKFDVNRQSHIIHANRRKIKGYNFYKELVKIYIKGLLRYQSKTVSNL